MPYRLEISLKPELFDAEGASVRTKARRYFGIELESVRAISVLTIDADLSAEQLERIRTEIFTNPVTQVSSYSPLAGDFDWALWVGYRPGVMDTAGATAVEAVEDLLGIRFRQGRSRLHFQTVSGVRAGPRFRWGSSAGEGVAGQRHHAARAR